MEYTKKEWLIDYDDYISIHNVLYYTFYCSIVLLNHEENIIKEVIKTGNIDELLELYEEKRLQLGQILTTYAMNIQRETELEELKQMKQSEIKNINELQQIETQQQFLSLVNEEKKENEIQDEQELLDILARKRKSLDQLKKEKEKLSDDIIQLSITLESLKLEQYSLNKQFEVYNTCLTSENNSLHQLSLDSSSL